MNMWQKLWSSLNPAPIKPPSPPIRRPLQEGVLANDFWLGSYVDLLDRFRDGSGASYPISNPQDRRFGSNYPFWYSEQQLSLIRAQARLITTTNPNALGLLNGLSSYVIGSGFNYRIAPKGTIDIDESMVRRCQDIMERFIVENEWDIMEQEIFARSRTDGEVFLRLFPQPSGRLLIRTIEPEMVYQPPGESFDTWSYGIETVKDDVFNVVNYHVDYNAPRGKSDDNEPQINTSIGEFVRADRIIHIKCNVMKAMKRGLSDFSYETLDMFSLAGKLRKNLGEAASVQSAIAAIRQHDTATASQVETFVESNIDFSVTGGSPNNRQTDYQRLEPGSFLDIPKGMNYVQPPGAERSTDHLGIFQALLRSAGNRHNAPEWLTSANIAGANYASSLTAESPFLRNCLRLQVFYKRHLTRIAREVIRTAAEYGELPINILDVVDVMVTPPAVEARDKIADSQANQTYVDMGIKSAQTVTQELGMDFNIEQRNIQQQSEKMANSSVPGQDDSSQVADSALNGLQIENLVGIVMRVATGQLSPAIGRAVARAAFPLMAQEQIDNIFPDALANTQPMPDDGKEAPSVSPVAESVSINFKPPASVQAAAKRGLELRTKHNRGGTAVGVARARDLMNGANLSPSTIKRMVSYFARHEVDKKGEGWGVDSAGYIAWLLWGGDSGWSWARKISNQIDSADGKKKDVSEVQYGKPGKDDPRKTPAKPDERKKGSKENPKGSAAKANSDLDFSKGTDSQIRKLMQKHNEKDSEIKASMAALKSVFRRGSGAFSTSHAPGMSRSRWGLKRVEAFLYLLRNGRPSNPNYKQDNDLLPKEHKRYSGGSEKE